MFKFFRNITKEETKFTTIINKLPENGVVCKQILELLNNRKTRVKLDEDLKYNYYFFANDTIYLSDKKSSKTNYQRIAIIAHECAHSMQSKLMQITNFTLSNLELVAFVISTLLLIHKLNINIAVSIYFIINIISIIPRLILEIDAVLKADSLCQKYIIDKVSEEEFVFLHNGYKSNIAKYLIIFIFMLLIGKIIRLLTIWGIYYISTI